MAISGRGAATTRIAQAQINEPELLILDEPAASLDPLGRRDVLAILARLRETSTVIYSTHIFDDVQRVSDTVAILKGEATDLHRTMPRGVQVVEKLVDIPLPPGTASFYDRRRSRCSVRIDRPESISTT